MSWQTSAEKNNLDISVLRLSELEGLSRIDAEYYKPRFLEEERLLRIKDGKRLSEYGQSNSGFVFPSEIMVENALNNNTSGRIIKMTQILENGFVILDTAAHIEAEYELENESKIRASNLVEKDILIALTGATVGKSGIVIYPDDKKNSFYLNQRILRLRSKYWFYVWFFSKTYFFRNYVIRGALGGAQPNTSPNWVLSIPIPTAHLDFLRTLETFAEKIIILQRQTTSLYKEAEQILLKEINLEGYEGTGEGISVRNFSEALADNRFDAEYWQPKYDEIEKRVSEIPQEKLGDIVSVKKGVEVGSEEYSEEGKGFIRVSDFTAYGIEDNEKKISEELYARLKENYKPKKGEVLLTKDGTIGISFALNEDVDLIVSSAFLRLNPKVKINNNYLALVLNSLYCKAQIERMSGGAVIAHLKPESAMQVRIPMLSDVKQEELAGMVLEAFRLRKEAKVLLEKAKRAVEIFIEEDEISAIKYLKSNP